MAAAAHQVARRAVLLRAAAAADWLAMVVPRRTALAALRVQMVALQARQLRQSRKPI
jgi:hypothetical protein